MVFLYEFPDLEDGISGCFCQSLSHEFCKHVERACLTSRVLLFDKKIHMQNTVKHCRPRLETLDLHL
jgi:hypothetical protein